MINRVVHFEIQADNPERAIQFYKRVFGWEFRKWEGPSDYWFIKTGEPGQRGINGGLVRRRKEVSGGGLAAYICTVHVESVDETVSLICGQGGQMTEPRIPIPGTGWLAYCKDTEGNVFALIEYESQSEED